MLALESMNKDLPNHAVCAVGIRCGSVKPQAVSTLKFREEATSLVGVYIQDDRLGPYAFAELKPHTDPNTKKIRTRVAIEWPDKKPDEDWLIYAVVVPVPQKLRLSITKMRRLGLIVAQAMGEAFSDLSTTLNCSYKPASEYRKAAYGFGLSSEGLYQLACKTALSRFIGLVEIKSGSVPVLDVILDTTETNPEPAVFACVRRAGFPADGDAVLDAITKHLDAARIL